MIRVEATAPTFPNKVAQSIVREINGHVNAMIGDSKVIEGRWEKKDETFGLFQNNELQLGQLLGSGGFSDVYEVLSFEPRGNVSKFADHQLAVRHFYKNNAIKNGKGKYAVKHLKIDNMENPSKFCMAAADLVVEAQLLSSLNHQNILRICGWSAGGINSFSDGEHDGYFLLLDRLNGTLGERIDTWKNKKQNRPLAYSFNRLCLTSADSSRLLSRTRIAHQTASAIEYLHSKNIVFRDLKPDNIGFDENGVVKLFDFGLARELPEQCTNVGDVYSMSGRVGTVRYMAPEVALARDYNQKVDTYSWSIIFWQCLSLEKPYAQMNRSTHLELVCRFGERPKLSNEMPESIRKLLTSAWAQFSYSRLSMTEVCVYLERIEKELESCLNTTRRDSWVSRPVYRGDASNTVLSVA